MGLDKEIIKHLDQTDIIKEDLLSIIDEVIKDINIDALILSPSEELERIASLAKIEIESKHEEMARLGLEFAEVIKTDKIEIQRSKDANLNEGELDG